jgi:hypothetical protein
VPHNLPRVGPGAAPVPGAAKGAVERAFGASQGGAGTRLLKLSRGIKPLIWNETSEKINPIAIFHRPRGFALSVGSAARGSSGQGWRG